MAKNSILLMLRSAASSPQLHVWAREPRAASTDTVHVTFLSRRLIGTGLLVSTRSFPTSPAMRADISSGRKENFTHDVFLSHNSIDKATVRVSRSSSRSTGFACGSKSGKSSPATASQRRSRQDWSTPRAGALPVGQRVRLGLGAVGDCTFRFRDPLNRERHFIPISLADIWHTRNYPY